MIWLVAAALLLQPVLDADAHLRMVATGTHGDPVEWHLDGQRVAVTRDGEAASVEVHSGEHDLWAVSAAEGTWSALARPEGNGTGAAFVDGWVADHPPVRRAGDTAWTVWVLAATGLLILVARPKRP